MLSRGWRPAVAPRVAGWSVALSVLLLIGNVAMATTGAVAAAGSRFTQGDQRSPQPLPNNVRPTLADAARDREVLASDGCTLSEVAVEPRTCVFGDTNGRVTVALVGDSHAAQWFPALNQIAKQRGWRLVTFTKVACRFVDMRIYSRTLKREYTECERWRTIVIQRLVALAPALVVVGSSRGMAPMVAADGDAKRQGQAMARLLRPIKSRIAVLVDTPWWTSDVPTCLAGHQRDVRACDVARPVALGWRHGIAERTAVAGMGATLVDMTNAICPSDPCRAVASNMIIYRDSFHLTATFAAALAPRLSALLPQPGTR